MNLGEKLKSRRENEHLTQDDLAEYLKITRQTISKWENDKSVPTLDYLVKLSDLYKITLDELVTGNKVKKPLSKKIKERIPMSLKDYFKFFITDSKEDLQVDYIVVFKNQRPELCRFPDLQKAGIWKEYGSTAYRLWCKFPKYAFENFIEEVTNIPKSEFSVIMGSEYAGMF